MREAAVALLGDRTHFQAIEAPAEATTLPNESLDFITAAQAFHWFAQAKAKIEFRRILRPEGYVLLIWNEWRQDTPFLQTYQDIVESYSVDYGAVNRRRVTEESKEEAFQRFFGNYETRTFDNVQLLDFAGVKGRLLSSSYAPLAEHTNHAPMLAALQAAFDEYAVDGRIAFTYDCHVHYGHLDHR
jgi:ubiquinone/menaquinone biosynthesis C-methylase UbiE